MPNLQDRITRTTRLLEAVLSFRATYHNHKETMANAVMVVQLTLAAGVLSVTQWPLPWVPYSIFDIAVEPKYLLLVAYSFVWLLISMFMRWQLRCRRWAAVFVGALEETLRNWAMKNPELDELSPYVRAETPKKNLPVDIVDSWLFPWRTAMLYSDVSREGWPTALGLEWERKASAYTKEPVPGEWLLSAGSWTALAIVAARIILG